MEKQKSEDSNHKKPKKNGLLSALEVANYLKISKRTLWRLLSSGEVPEPIRFGGNVRWSVATLETWIEEGCPKSAN